MTSRITKSSGGRHVLIMSVLAALAQAGCAAFQPSSATGPHSAEPTYPILLTEDGHRREASLAAIRRLAQISERANGAQPALQPVTATVASLDLKASSSLYLPKVGTGAAMSEEETRESLRRFIREWESLIGADAEKLSLIERTDQPNGVKSATYEQRPFRYPIRGNYGKLQITFAGDRKVLNLMSSCIPDADRIQTALSAITIKLKAEDVVQKLRNEGVSSSASNANNTHFSVNAATQLEPRGLTTYIMPASNGASTLEFHLAWEVEFTGAPFKFVYVDAISGDIIAVA